MRLNKLLLFLAFLFFINIYAQPSTKKYYFYGNIYVLDNNKKLQFSTKDSTHLFSKTAQMELSIVQTEIDTPKNNRPLMFENKVHKFIKIRSIKSEYWNEQKIGVFELIFKIEKNSKIMLIHFNFSNSKKDTKLEKFVINFKEGEYEVTDSQKPELIFVK
ncbi:hypothetical protein ACSLMH_00175 [Flavobacterium columnare]|uniref:hypothetical protein n=1 Tax=Flavobacterium columnare TaxID=996 RepID=UPI004034B24F